MVQTSPVGGKHGGGPLNGERLTLEVLAAHKKLPKDSLTGLGLADTHGGVSIP